MVKQVNFKAFEPLKRRKTATLVAWWDTLNRWEWVAEVGAPEPRATRGYEMPRRHQAMEKIEHELGMRVILGRIKS